MEAYGPNAATGTVSVTIFGSPVEGPQMLLSPRSSVRLNVNEDFLSKEWNQTATWSDGKRTFELHGPRLYLQASLDPVGDLDFEGGRSIRPPAGPKDDALVIEDVRRAAIDCDLGRSGVTRPQQMLEEWICCTNL